MEQEPKVEWKMKVIKWEFRGELEVLSCSNIKGGNLLREIIDNWLHFPKEKAENKFRLMAIWGNLRESFAEPISWVDRTVFFILFLRFARTGLGYVFKPLFRYYHCCLFLRNDAGIILFVPFWLGFILLNSHHFNQIQQILFTELLILSKSFVFENIISISISEILVTKSFSNQLS